MGREDLYPFVIVFDTRRPDGTVIERDRVALGVDRAGNVIALDSDGVEVAYPALEHPMIVNVRARRVDGLDEHGRPAPANGNGGRRP